jgi:hypothetical protein
MLASPAGATISGAVAGFGGSITEKLSRLDITDSSDSGGPTPRERAHSTDFSTMRATPASTFARWSRISAADQVPLRGLIAAKAGFICVAVSKSRKRVSAS